MISKAPIGISTYARPDHLRLTVEALMANELASDTVVYVFSDAPQKGDEEKVDEVRTYLSSIQPNFKDFIVVERTENSRIANNRGGMKEMANLFGRLIFIEEDVLTAPNFLSFMNEGLEKYSGNKDVLNISAYVPPIVAAHSIANEAFTLPRFNAWGFATWGDRLDSILKGVEKQKFKRKAISWSNRHFCRDIGDDFIKMAMKDFNGEIDAFDVKAMVYQFMNNMLTIYPPSSLVNNIGFDGSGLHCNDTDRFDVQLNHSINQSIEFPINLEPRKDLMKANRRFRKMKIENRVKTFARLLTF